MSDGRELEMGLGRRDWFEGFRKRVTLNIDIAKSLGDELYRMTKEQPAPGMIEWTRRAGENFGPRPQIQGIGGGVDSGTLPKKPVLLDFDPISEDDIILDIDPSLP